jgi:glycosyltransferase involved in cell wall biosynthesis
MPVSRPLRLLMLTRYGRLGASSRVRSHQFVSHLEDAGFSVKVVPLLDDRYIRALYDGHRIGFLPHLPGTLLRRGRNLREASEFDVVWIEKDALPWIPTALEQLLLPRRTPLVLDFDDAVYHSYARPGSALVQLLLRNKIPRMMQRAELVVAGNRHVAEYAREAGAKAVEVIPSSVDTTRFAPRPDGGNDVTVVGWIGNPGTSAYLDLVADALNEASTQVPFRFLAIGAREVPRIGLGTAVVPWSEETEAGELSRIDVGIMPLPDGPFERGKSGYKLVQYMAAGKPSLASPVGANADIIEHGRTGFLASTPQEWRDRLVELLQNRELRARMGWAGRARCEAEFSLAVSAPRLARALQGAANAGASRLHVTGSKAAGGADHE